MNYHRFRFKKEPSSIVTKKGILMISPFFRPNIGGVEIHLDELCEYLRKHDFRIYVATYQPLTTREKGLVTERKENLEIRRFPWFGHNWFPRLERYPVFDFIYITPGLFIYTFFYLLWVRKKIDIIHAHGLNAAFIGLICSILFRKKFIVSTHAIYRLDKKPCLSVLIKSILRYTDRILALGEESRKELIGSGLELDRVEKYIYSVNRELFKPLDKKVCRQKLGLPLEKFIALFVGRFVAQKGLKVLTESIRYIDSNVLFVFIGEGPDKKFINEVASNFKNVILCGSIPNNELVNYYSAADCFSWGSVDGDVIGKVCIESLFCGLPIIAPNRVEINGMQKEVNFSSLPERVGFLVEPNAEVLAEKLNYLSKNKYILDAMRVACRKFAEDKYGFKNMESIIKAYLEVN